MSKKPPGFIRRFFSLLGKILSFIRNAISVVITLLFLFILFNLVSSSMRPLPEKAVLRLAPSGYLVDQLSRRDPLTLLFQDSGHIDLETRSGDLIEAIDAAAGDPRITGIVMDLDLLVGGGISKLEEIGTALKRFRKSNKPIVAIGDHYSQEQYYLASYADEIHLNPLGAVMITGYGMYPGYFRGALDKLKVNVHVFRAGEYKDAIEPFVLKGMSDKSREHKGEWLHSLWDTYSSRIESLRGLPRGAIDDYANNLDAKFKGYAGDASLLALKSGLVDYVQSRNDILKRLIELAGYDEENDDYLHIDHKTYLAHLRALKKLNPPAGDNKIGIIVASGMIMDGDLPEGTIGGDTMSQLVRTARTTDDIKALVIRVDSPGGSAFASEIIRREIQAARENGLPVVVSMGSVAASGGYWISTDSDEIWAQPTTLTGSIGVFGIIPSFENTLNALGVRSDGLGTTRLADFMRIDRPLSEASKTIIQSGVDNIYHRFLQVVADGRGSTSEEVEKIAEGRVWTGERAKELGLVDKLGTLEDAIKAAARLAQLEVYQLEYIRRPLSFQEQLFEQLTTGEAGSTLLSEVGAMLPLALRLRLEKLSQPLAVLESFNDPRGLYAVCFECAGN